MKVEGPGRAREASSSRKKSKVSGGSFGEFMTSLASKASPAKTTHSIAQLDSLLAVQGVEDPTARAARQRMRQRADTILSELDQIRLAMLGGTLTVGHMIDIADVVAAHREKISDPALTAIMDEIDLRAQVELAKMRVALNGRQAG